MSLVSPPELFADLTDAKDTVDSKTDSPDKVIQLTALIATVQEDELIVTRRELWSSYPGQYPLGQVVTYSNHSIIENHGHAMAGLPVEINDVY